MSAINIILRADAYKHTHGPLFPPKTTFNFSYIESRGIDSKSGLGPDTEVVFFGLQAYIKKYLETKITIKDIKTAKRIIEKTGLKFDMDSWVSILGRHGGYLPVSIRALPEGSILKPGVMMVSAESTDPEFPWLASFIETSLQRAVWYPSTVATVSRETKKIIKTFLDLTSDFPDIELPFKLHDFGARGVSSGESAEIGGAAHLVNFLGTDTLEALPWIEEYYYDDKDLGFSIPASEHSTITSWGRENERDAYKNMLDVYKDAPIIACVSDSYNIYNACSKIWPSLKDDMAEGQIVVVRPDSGDPVQCVMDCLEILEREFGSFDNSKGFKVLNQVRVIQGDGIDISTVKEICQQMYNVKFSITNIAFGMGGGLLQKVNRDTLKFAQKTSAVKVDGKLVDVFKNPIDDVTKKSKKGILDTVQLPNGMFKTVEGFTSESVMSLVYEGGPISDNRVTFSDVRKNAEIK